jgi:hypothetical protein
MTAAATAVVFERLAQRYDDWYEGPVGRVVFPLEVGCLAPLLARSHPPRLEVGVGSGRFAAELGAGVGVDPAAAPLRLARSRGIAVVQGRGGAPAVPRQDVRRRAGGGDPVFRRRPRQAPQRGTPGAP